MNIAVLGCSGAMGGFFTRYFLRKGNKVIGIDPARARLRNKLFRYAGMDYDSIESVDAALVAVPMESTLDTIKTAMMHMKKGRVIIEISSLKKFLHDQLKMLEIGDFTIVSLHPLFGQSLKSPNDGTIAITPFKDKKSEVRTANMLFPDFRFRLISPSKHDEAMSLVISLTHAINVAYAKMLCSTKKSELLGLITPIAGTQLVISRAVLSQSPRLIAQLQCRNRYTAKTLNFFAKVVEEIANKARKGQEQDIEREIASLKDTSQDLLSYEAVYKAELWRIIHTMSKKLYNE
ncbi:MAG: prephenate dehydrogenase/arogenate dehydrogenase family protein [Conexivisphaerales archaeon]